MLYDLFIAPFADFAFMRHALVGTIAVTLGAAPVGVFLVLRRMSLVGDAMAHAILPGAAIGYLMAGLSLGAMTLGGLVAGFAVAILSGLVARNTILKEDASLASFYLMSLALGVIIVSLRGSNIDLLHVLFGSVLALDDEALILLGEITTITLVVLALLYRSLVMECVDPGYLRSVSWAGPATHLVFLGLVVMNLVASFHAMGTLLAVGVMMLPAIAARFWASGITGMIFIATAIGILSGVAGLLASYHWGLPTGPTIILAAGIAYLFSLAFGSQGGVVLRLLPPATKHA